MPRARNGPAVVGTCIIRLMPDDMAGIGVAVRRARYAVMMPGLRTTLAIGTLAIGTQGSA